MAKRFRAAGGKIAIWDGHTDTLPFDDPLAYLSRVKFHSDLDYLNIIDEKVFTLNLPAIPASGSGQGSGGRNGLRAASYTLGAHGRPGQPFFIARIVVSGVPVAFTGSVPVQQDASGDFYARWLAIGCDATSIIAHEYSVQLGNAGTQFWSSRPAASFQIRCYITDLLL